MRQTARRTALGQDLGPIGRLRHRPAHRRRRPPGSSARLCSPEPRIGGTDRPRQAPLMGLVSLQRVPAALRCPGMPYSRTIPLRCCGWPRPSAISTSQAQSSRIPASASAHSCGFSPGATGSDVSFPSSFACSPPTAGHSPERPFQLGVPVLARRVCAAWPAFCMAGSAHGIQPFAAFFRPDRFAASSVVEAHVSFACPTLLDGFGRGIGRQTSKNADAADQNVPGSTSGRSPVQPAVLCLSLGL